MSINGLTPQGLPAHPAGQPTDKSTEDLRLRKACADFEGILLQYMFESMQKSVDENGGIFGNSHQKQMYESMFIQEVSATLAKQRGLGLAESLYRQAKGQMAQQEEGAAQGVEDLGDSKADTAVNRYREYKGRTDAATGTPPRIR